MKVIPSLYIKETHIGFTHFYKKSQGSFAQISDYIPSILLFLNQSQTLVELLHPSCAGRFSRRVLQYLVHGVVQ